jgi:hypothetical protein
MYISGVRLEAINQGTTNLEISVKICGALVDGHKSNTTDVHVLSGPVNHLK